MLAVRGIVEAAIPRKLIGLLTVLSAALAIALPRDAAEAAMRFADLAEGEREVDERQDVVYASALLLRPARRHHHGGRGLSEEMCRLDDLLGRNASDSFGSIRPVGRRRPAGRLRNPVVRAAMNSWSMSLSRTAT